MAINWKNNRLGKRIFGFGLGMYLVFSILVYFVIYAGIPILYQNYKVTDFNNRVDYVINNSETVDQLTSNISTLIREAAIGVSYQYNGFEYSCISYSECHQVIENPKMDGSFIYDEREDYLNRREVLMIEGRQLTINFSSAISSTSEVQSVLFLFLPIFGVLSVIMAFILAIFLSTRLSRSILKLRDDAIRITSLNFDIEQSVKSNDELGDLSYNLVVLANALSKTLNELQAANERLYSDIEKERFKEEERRAFIATISHDLKTPLTAIKGQLEGMLYNIGKYKDHETYLKNNIELTNGMEKLIQSIIVSSKLDDYNMEVNKQPMLIKSFVDSSLKDLDYLIGQRCLNIIENVDGEYILNVDVNLFGRALNNLIGNAVEYADTGTFISVELQNNVLKIANKTSDFDETLIEDDLIFKPFFRQDKSRNKNGTGLGMYIVKRICDLHDIKIDVKYDDDIFTILLYLNVKN